ncbi:division/outer membrane stress-associated lipid-binding lipoprotein [Candidatus Doolittlea endobia]|uniref:Osmotically-inducible protein Y n=1 Tax=Candidatus Doolittlea endobia TaxID=1778262 RepID=A0A143WSH0_9ENTR|nr:division/outer membrane stress-associated lipid-binding lipoprotein [Candidatus Doolittlea endobia]CUX96776.1 Osmotically-inducible protein Y precursor [Candidatus Doolittlea endobia]
MKIHPLVFLLCTTLILQGCVGAMVIGTAAIATKIATDPRTIGTQVDDGIIKVRVANALTKDQQLKKDTRIVNTVYQGKVLLTGQALTPELAEHAKQISMNVDSVTEVYNEIRQGQPISLRRTSIDTWITIKIRSQLLARDVVKSFNIKLTTENGEVFLLGLVTNAEGKAATEVASKVNGVKHVTTAFTYLQ